MPDNNWFEPGLDDDWGYVMPPYFYEQAKRSSKPTVNECEPQEAYVNLEQEVRDVQAAVLLGLQNTVNEPHVIVPRDEDLIAQLRTMSVEDIVAAFGDFLGTRLRNYCLQVDFDHPAVQEINRKAFTPDSEFCKTLREIINLTRLCSEQQLSRALGLLRDSFMKAKEYKEVRLLLCKPLIRALRDGQEREEARQCKSFKFINVKGWQKGSKGWSDYPSSMLIFVRLNDSHLKEIEQNKIKSKKFQEIGCSAVAATFLKHNAVLQEFIQERYCGFTKLRMIDAAILTAKMHGVTLAENRSLFYRKGVFARNKFYPEAGKKYLTIECGTAPVNLDYDKEMEVDSYLPPEQYVCVPRAYPLHVWQVPLAATTRTIMAQVDSHPDMGGKAIFDQFWVIVPGVQLLEENFFYDNRWVLIHGDRCELYDRQQDAERALDQRLTLDGVFHPMVLGEKDGRCYFVCYYDADKSVVAPNG